MNCAKGVILTLLITLSLLCYASSEKNSYRSINREKRGILGFDIFSATAIKPYDGGQAKTLVKIFAPNQQHHIKPNYASSLPHLLPWKKFSNFLLGGPSQHNNKNINYDTFVATMGPRQNGVLHSFEKSEWYQTLASYCIDYNPDSYSFSGFLCNVITDFGINVFIEAITFKELMTCAAIGYATGDSLFCLAWYLMRFFFSDYVPNSIKEEYYYADNRLKMYN